MACMVVVAATELISRHPECQRHAQVFLQSPAGSAAAVLLLSSWLSVTVGPPDLSQTLVGPPRLAPCSSSDSLPDSKDVCKQAACKTIGLYCAL